MGRLLRIRHRISAQLYAGLGGAVLLTVAASLVGLFFFARVGEFQSRVNEGSVPELAAAFGVARYSGTLVEAGPRLTAAATQGEVARVTSGIEQARRALDVQTANLARGNTTGVNLTLARDHVDTLAANLDAIANDRVALFELNQESNILRAELARLRASQHRVVVPGIDDQLFYTLTGYRELGEPPARNAEHFTTEEFNRYRYLAGLQADGNIASELLVGAFSVADPSSIEPLRERFISAGGRVERSLAALEGSELHGQVAPIFNRLFEMGLEQGGGFDLLEQRGRLTQRQGELLAANRDIGVGLLSEVDKLVAAAEVSAEAATRSSDQAFMTGRTLLLVISAVSIGGALLIAWLFVGRVLLRRLQALSERMRRMAEGNLEAPEAMVGQDEIADMARALEVFRHHAQEVLRLNDVETANAELAKALTELRLAQDQIVAQEKLAELGQLTAGVAHEIRNPLSFVMNFSLGSADLLAELQETLDEHPEQLDDEQQELIREISGELSANMERIRSHGERANRIIQDMLLMGRDGGERQSTDINGLLDQNTRLAYHSARASDPDFQLDWREDLDPDLGDISVVPQDLGRVFLNMVGNACYATAEKRQAPGADPLYKPTLWLATRRDHENVEILIRDNGNGIPADVVDKIFNPFFTTKPADRGTGLGLAICNDIVRQHGGTIRVETEAGEFTEMIIQIPVTPPAPAPDGATAISTGAGNG